MRRGKVAKLLGVDPNTITDWVTRDQFTRFFSIDAHAEGKGVQRTFNESDVLVLNTIRTGRSKNQSWDEIAKELESGTRELDLPPSALMVETTAPIAQYGKIQAYEARIDLLEQQIHDMGERHIEELEILRTERDDWIERAGELREEIGMLKALLKMEQQRNEDGHE